MRLKLAQSKKTTGVSAGTINSVSVEYLKQCFDYRDGVLYWKDRPRHHFDSDQTWKCFITKWAGKPAGKCGTRGYYTIRITLSDISVLFKRSHLVWRLFGNHIPDGQVLDHRDGNTSNDRYENLRCCPQTKNIKNRKLNCNSKSGIKGVYALKDNRWTASICVDNKQINLGRFDSAEEAAKARTEAEERFFGEFRREIPEPKVVLTADEEFWINSIGSL